MVLGQTIRLELQRMANNIRPFLLHRQVDISGVSGTGIVAEGIQFSDGHCAIHWLGAWPTTTPHPSLESIIGVHGHGGATEVVWLDV